MVYGLDGMDAGDGTVVAAQVRPDYEGIRERGPREPDEEDVYEIVKRFIAEENQKLPNYKRIRHIVIREEEFVKTTTHKIKRQANL